VGAVRLHLVMKFRVAPRTTEGRQKAAKERDHVETHSARNTSAGSVCAARLAGM